MNDAVMVSIIQGLGHGHQDLARLELVALLRPIQHPDPALDAARRAGNSTAAWPSSHSVNTPARGQLHECGHVGASAREVVTQREAAAPFPPRVLAPFEFTFGARPLGTIAE